MPKVSLQDGSGTIQPIAEHRRYSYFSKGISLKMNITVLLEFELAYKNVTINQFCHYAIETPQVFRVFAKWYINLRGLLNSKTTLVKRLVSFFVQWHINLRGWDNAKVLFVEELQWYSVNNFPKSINPNVNVKPEFEIVNTMSQSSMLSSTLRRLPRIHILVWLVGWLVLGVSILWGHLTPINSFW